MQDRTCTAYFLYYYWRFMYMREGVRRYSLRDVFINQLFYNDGAITMQWQHGRVCAGSSG